MSGAGPRKSRLAGKWEGSDTVGRWGVGVLGSPLACPHGEVRRDAVAWLGQYSPFVLTRKSVVINTEKCDWQVSVFRIARRCTFLWLVRAGPQVTGLGPAEC